MSWEFFFSLFLIKSANYYIYTLRDLSDTKKKANIYTANMIYTELFGKDSNL